MNRDEAKAVLTLYRPGTADAEDPQVVAAMEVARQDPELANWFRQHAQFQSLMRRKLREIEVPGHWKAGLLARAKSVSSPPWWTRPPVVRLGAAAAVCALVLGLAVWWPRAGGGDRFADFREGMVSEVQRQYAMDWETSDMNRLRESIAARGGRSDYAVPKGLARLKLTGGGVLKWQKYPVSMVCFDRGGGQMLFLFVMNREAVKDPPAQTPQLSVVHEYKTASWTQGGNAYVLAGPEDEDLATFTAKYLD